MRAKDEPVTAARRAVVLALATLLITATAGCGAREGRAAELSIGAVERINHGTCDDPPEGIGAQPWRGLCTSVRAAMADGASVTHASTTAAQSGEIGWSYTTPGHGARPRRPGPHAAAVLRGHRLLRGGAAAQPRDARPRGSLRPPAHRVIVGLTAGVLGPARRRVMPVAARRAGRRP